MAYDPNSAYEPPRRAYCGQTQQSAPVQDNYAYQQQQEQYGGYSQQSWNGGYDQQYNQNNGYWQDVRQGRKAQSPQYEEAYQSGYQNPRQQSRGPPNGHEQQQRRQERQYDPRYQQRHERGRQPAYEQPQRQAQTQQPALDTQVQQQSVRPNPKNARMYPQEGQVQKQTVQQAPPRIQDTSSARPRTAPQAEKKHDPSKMTMEEWKAKEKARMHAEAMFPETLSWDNAFPTFPTARDRSRPGTANEERADSLKAGSLNSNGQRQDERPKLPRDNSYNNESIELLNDRPQVDHKPYSFEPIKDRPAQQPTSPVEKQRMQFERLRANYGNSADPGAQPQQELATEQRPSPQIMQADRRQPPPTHATAPQYREVAQQNVRNVSQPRQAPSRGPPVQPIDTKQAQRDQRPVFMDHQPLSPASVPQRPSTSHAARSPLGPSVTAPTSAYLQAQTPHDQFDRQAAQSRPMPQPLQMQQQISNGTFGDYSESQVTHPVTAPPRSRDREIESEMPDFDSAAPGGTSLLHKRSQVNHQRIKEASRSPAANKPPQQMNSSVASLPVQPQQQFYYQQEDPSSQSLPEQQGRKQKQGGITNGFVFGIPGESVQQQSYDYSYQQEPQLRQEMPYQQSSRPFQPPYAREQQPRKSMDDARQMPYRQGPHYQQSMQQHGRPPRGPPPPAQSRGVDRAYSGHRGQPDYSGPPPAQQRVGSAPPMQQGFQEPPGRGPDRVPLTQQRSAPEVPVEPRRGSNPDSLPQHPTPVRPGLVEGGMIHSSKPPPVRNYANGPPQHQRQASVDPSKPVTPAELDHLRARADAHPNDSKQALLLVKKLVEAATVLAPEGGRANPQTATKNRERYILDAHKRLKRLASAGYADAQFYLADCYGEGSLGLQVDHKEAFNLYQAAAKAGHPEAAYRTAMCCEMGSEDGGGARKDYAKAVQWYRRAAALGNPSGMFKVGVIALKGLLGQQRNIGEGVSWLKRAAESQDYDNPQAFYELAVLHESANTNPEVRNKVVADDQYALELFQKAAGMGHKFAQFRLGQVHEYGSMGLPIDNRSSIAWYSKAAAQGEHQAELALSGWYLTGAAGILEHSDMEAYLWARKAAAAEPPLAKALFAMGYFTETGIGCPKSIEEARKWYGRAASYRFPKALERLEELKKNGGKGSKQVNGRLSRKDQKRDEAECALM